MNERFERPQAVFEAEKTQKGQPMILEILLFLGVFILGFLAEMLIRLPGELVLLYGNQEYLVAMQAEDFEKLMEISSQIASTNAYSILCLITNLGMILAVWFSCKFFQRRKLTSLGFVKKDAGKEYLRGALFGLLVFSGAVLLCVITGAIKIQGFSKNFSIGIFAGYCVGFLIQSMAEEMLCRGYFMVSVARKHSMIAAILANSILFAMLHLLNSGISALAFINLVLYGIFASVYFIKRGNIWAPAAFHGVWNLVQGNVYGISVSGTTQQCSVLSSVVMEGKQIWNGGAFGLEGGLAVTFLLLVATAYLYFRKTNAPSSAC